MRAVAMLFWCVTLVSLGMLAWSLGGWPLLVVYVAAVISIWR